MALGATLLALLPMLAAILVDAAPGYSPLADEALIDLHVRDVLSLHLPLLGPYSRYGWNHPGPALYYALAPFSAITGSAAWGTMAGGAALQAIAVIALAVIAWRTGGWKLVVGALLVLGVAYSTQPVAVVLDPWSPYVLFPFFLVFVFAVWASADGDPVQLVVATAVASFLVQTHVGYGPFIVAAVVFLVFTLGGDWRGKRLPTAQWGRILASSAVVGVAMWTPVLIEQFTHDPGNLSKIFDHFTQHKATATVGFSDGLKYFADGFKFPPPWLAPVHKVEVDRASVLWLVVPILLLTIGALAARASKSRRDARMIGLAAVLSVAGVVAFAGIEPPTFSYLVMWRAPLCAFVCFASLSAVARYAIRGRTVRPVSIISVVALIAIAWSFGGLALRVLDHGRPVAAWNESPVLLAKTLARENPHAGAVLVSQVGGGLSGVDFGLIDELDRRGVDARVDARINAADIARNASTPRDVKSIWYLVMEPLVNDYAARPGARILARLTPLSPGRDRELRNLQAWYLAAIHSRGRDDLAFLAASPLVSLVERPLPDLDPQRMRRLIVLNNQVEHAARCRCAVVAVPPAEADGSQS